CARASSRGAPTPPVRTCASCRASSSPSAPTAACSRSSSASSTAPPFPRPLSRSTSATRRCRLETTREETLHPRRQRLHRPPPVAARARRHRLGGVRHGHGLRARGGPHGEPALPLLRG